ncbi:MAG: Mov34/MPN/PAD-1 family protein [Candidatus Promineifilaceae bacterium]|nr:Mov34/MPN/PAD-1 family protein [Candidatus Promineifilaceae bacterium]
MLLPADIIPVEGKTKLLRDCTLRDLQIYASELEKDVWDTYESISLFELDEDEQVSIEVALGVDSETSLDHWDQQVLLLPTEDRMLETQELDEAYDVQDAIDEEAEDPPFQVDQLTETETEDEAEPDVSVAETELVYPEIEEDVVKTVEPLPEETAKFPDIIPSKARVRVAGDRLPLGHPTWAAVDILIDEPALRATQAHALSSLQREVAGVLVGRRPEKQPDGRYLVHIFDTIVAKHTVMQGASVTYTPESWRYLNDTLAERYPDETAVMVGWYHTHPGFGIFLSGMDLFIHQNFFTQIWHVAMVLDPRARTTGFFCWDRSKSRVSRCDFAWPKWAASSW